MTLRVLEKVLPTVLPLVISTRQCALQTKCKMIDHYI